MTFLHGRVYQPYLWLIFLVKKPLEDLVKSLVREVFYL